MLFQTLEFTPLEFETTAIDTIFKAQKTIRIYSVGVWNPPNMVGDNRNHSFDSRFSGAVPYKFFNW